MAEDDAVDAIDEAWDGRVAEHEDGLSEEEHAQYGDERRAAATRARAEAGARWDAWFARVCETVDTLLGRGEAPGEDGSVATPGTVSEVSGSSRAATARGPDGRLYAYA